MQIRYQYLLFGIFTIVYAIYTGFGSIEDDKQIALILGIYLVIAGGWGLIAGEALIKVPFSVQKYSKYINGSLIVLGMFFLVYRLFMI